MEHLKERSPQRLFVLVQFLHASTEALRPTRFALHFPRAAEVLPENQVYFGSEHLRGSLPRMRKTFTVNGKSIEELRRVEFVLEVTQRELKRWFCVFSMSACVKCGAQDSEGLRFVGPHLQSGALVARCKPVCGGDQFA